MSAAALKYDPGQAHRPLGEHRPEELDEVARKITRSRPAISFKMIQKAGVEAGGMINGCVELLRKTKSPALRSMTETDVIRIADRVLKHVVETDRNAEKRTSKEPTARRLRAVVEGHAEVLDGEANERAEELVAAKKAHKVAAARLAQYDQPVHRQTLREAMELVAVCEAREAGARSKAAEFRASLKKHRRQFDELISLGVAGSATEWPRRSKAALERVEMLTAELAQIGWSLVEDLETVQNAAARARDLAERLGVPSNALGSHRAMGGVDDVRAHVSKAACRGLKKVGLSPPRFQDIFDPRRYWD